MCFRAALAKHGAQLLCSYAVCDQSVCHAENDSKSPSCLDTVYSKAYDRSMLYCILDQLEIQGEGHGLSLLYPHLYYVQIMTFTFFFLRE